MLDTIRRGEVHRILIWSIEIQNGADTGIEYSQG